MFVPLLACSLPGWCVSTTYVIAGCRHELYTCLFKQVPDLPLKTSQSRNSSTEIMAKTLQSVSNLKLCTCHTSVTIPCDDVDGLIALYLYNLYINTFSHNMWATGSMQYQHCNYEMFKRNLSNNYRMYRTLHIATSVKLHDMLYLAIILDCKQKYGQLNSFLSFFAMSNCHTCNDELVTFTVGLIKEC